MGGSIVITIGKNPLKQGIFTQQHRHFMIAKYDLSTILWWIIDYQHIYVIISIDHQLVLLIYRQSTGIERCVIGPIN